MTTTLPALLTPAEAARSLAICEKQLRRLAEAGQIAYINIGAGDRRETRRYAPADIEAFLERRRRVQCPSTAAQAKRTTHTTSGVRVIDFQARRDARAGAKRKKSRKG